MYHFRRCPSPSALGSLRVASSVTRLHSSISLYSNVVNRVFFSTISETPSSPSSPSNTQHSHSSPTPSSPPSSSSKPPAYPRSVQVIKGIPVDFKSHESIEPHLSLIEQTFRPHTNDGNFTTTGHRYHQVEQKLRPLSAGGSPQLQLRSLQTRKQHVDQLIKAYHNNKTHPRTRFYLSVPQEDERFYYRVTHVHPKLLLKSMEAFELTAQKQNLYLKYIANLPRHIKRYTLLKSPHVDKPARDQLEIRTLTRILTIHVQDNIKNNQRTFIKGPLQIQKELEESKKTGKKVEYTTQTSQRDAKHQIRVRAMALRDKVIETVDSTMKYQYKIPSMTTFRTATFVEDEKHYEAEDADLHYTTSAYSAAAELLDAMKSHRDNPKELYKGRLTQDLIQQWHQDVNDPVKPDWGPVVGDEEEEEKPGKRKRKTKEGQELKGNEEGEEESQDIQEGEEDQGEESEVEGEEDKDSAKYPDLPGKDYGYELPEDEDDMTDEQYRLHLRTQDILAAGRGDLFDKQGNPIHLDKEDSEEIKEEDERKLTEEEEKDQEEQELRDLYNDIDVVDQNKLMEFMKQSEMFGTTEHEDELEEPIDITNNTNPIQSLRQYKLEQRRIKSKALKGNKGTKK